MLRYEKKIVDFIKKHYKIIFTICIILLAIFVRITLFDFKSVDYVCFLTKWYKYLKIHGGLKALANYPGDYNAPYMTIMALLTYLPIKDIYAIKLVSVIFDFILALSSGLLVKEIVKKNKVTYFLITFCIVLFIPSVILNSSEWGQCDSIYSSFVILSLLFLMKKKYKTSFLMLGLAFSFKLQFIFILPLFVILYFCEEKFSILDFLIIPVTDIVMSIPAMIFGCPFSRIVKAYFAQPSTYQSQVLNFPNLYNMLKIESKGFAIGLTLFICAFALFYCLYKKVKFNDKKIMLLGIWFIAILTFLLPSMHERYAYVGEILMALYFIIYREKPKMLLFMLIVPLITYSSFLYGTIDSWTIPVLSFIYTIILFDFTKYTFDELKINNKN